MKRVKLHQLAIGTIFAYQGYKYKKGSSGTVREGVGVLEAHPYLGGVVQLSTALTEWIPADAEVVVDR